MAPCHKEQSREKSGNAGGGAVKREGMGRGLLFLIGGCKRKEETREVLFLFGDFFGGSEKGVQKKFTLFGFACIGGIGLRLSVGAARGASQVIGGGASGGCGGGFG